MKNLGARYIWLDKRLDITRRTVWEKDGRTFIRFEHKVVEVTKDEHGGNWVAQI